MSCFVYALTIFANIDLSRSEKRSAAKLSEGVSSTPSPHFFANFSDILIFSRKLVSKDRCSFRVFCFQGCRTSTEENLISSGKFDNNLSGEPRNNSRGHGSPN